LNWIEVEIMDAHNGLLSVWQQGDAVTRFVAVLLLGMSLASWVVMVLKALDLARLRKLAQGVGTFWDSPDYETGVRSLDDGSHFNPFKALANEGRNALSHIKARDGQPHLREQLDASEWVGRALQNSLDDGSARLQAGLAVLASVGSTSPFVGLFGTVWGIYHALMKIGMSGQSTIDQVAGPIGEALIMTALGLAVAIPAVLGYNALVRANKVMVGKLKRFAHDIHTLHVTGARLSPMAIGSKSPTAPNAPQAFLRA
jgi:biopolymer transport protein ExbB